jgi:hypothetical protein
MAFLARALQKLLVNNDTLIAGQFGDGSKCDCSLANGRTEYHDSCPITNHVVVPMSNNRTIELDLEG